MEALLAKKEAHLEGQQAQLAAWAAELQRREVALAWQQAALVGAGGRPVGVTWAPAPGGSPTSAGAVPEPIPSESPTLSGRALAPAPAAAALPRAAPPAAAPAAPPRALAAAAAAPASLAAHPVAASSTGSASGTQPGSPAAADEWTEEFEEVRRRGGVTVRVLCRRGVGASAALVRWRCRLWSKPARAGVHRGPALPCPPPCRCCWRRCCRRARMPGLSYTRAHSAWPLPLPLALPPPAGRLPDLHLRGRCQEAAPHPLQPLPLLRHQRQAGEGGVVAGKGGEAASRRARPQEGGVPGAGRRTAPCACWASFTPWGVAGPGGRRSWLLPAGGAVGCSMC